ncbi:hypothetical protein PQR66_19060 [Paraburkholderia agricolaris]|uniref:Uncharacterized protein n=1 Tax=Paraburkholderia agricolaris TaxID=2152888 RepID=A0ABW8ZRA0_9BURK
MGDRYVVQLNLYAMAVGEFNNLVLAKRYLVELLENDSARQYVAQRHPDLMVAFESIIATISLDQQQFSAVL